MKKKFICTLFIGLLLSLCACGSVEEVKEYAQSTTTVEEKQTQSVEESVTSEVVHETNEVKQANLQSTTIENITVEEQKEVEEETQVSANAFDQRVTLDDFCVIIHGTRVACGVNINTILDDLGSPDSYTEAKSCVDVGEEKSYTYGGYVLNTYPAGEQDIIYLIEFSGDAVTDANIGVGSSVADVEQAYGTDYYPSGEYAIYETAELASLSFKFTDGRVSYLDMYYKE